MFLTSKAGAAMRSCSALGRCTSTDVEHKRAGRAFDQSLTEISETQRFWGAVDATGLFSTVSMPRDPKNPRIPARGTGTPVAMGIGRLQPWVRVRSRVVSRLLQRYALVTSRSAAAGPATSQAHPLGSRGMDTVEKTRCYTPVLSSKAAPQFK